MGIAVHPTKGQPIGKPLQLEERFLTNEKHFVASEDGSSAIYFAVMLPFVVACCITAATAFSTNLTSI